MNEALIVLDEATFVRLGALVHRHTGITLSASRRSMLQGRLRPRLRDLKLATFKDYVTLLERTPAEVAKFVDAVTTNETYFFRTPRVWEHIAAKFLPDFMATTPRRPLNVWSAAASNGSEACSLAILLEEIRLKTPGFTFTITATDISAEILAEAQRGVYAGRVIEAFRTTHPDWFRRHMREVAGSPGQFQVAPELRARITFRRHNLFEPFRAAHKFDLVLLRNVLIYFTPADQTVVMNQVAREVDPRGLVIIGESESLGSLDVPFAYEGPMLYRPTRTAA